MNHQSSVLQDPPRSTESDRLEPTPINYEGSVRIVANIMEFPKDLTMYCEEYIDALSEPQRMMPTMNRMYQQDDFFEPLPFSNDRDNNMDVSARAATYYPEPATPSYKNTYEGAFGVSPAKLMLSPIPVINLIDN
jgi:hypothetical protein